MHFIIVLFKKFDCVFGSFPAPSSVSNAEHLVGLDEVVEGGVPISFAFVKDVGEAEEDGGDEYIGEGDDEGEPLKVHTNGWNIKIMQIF